MPPRASIIVNNYNYGTYVGEAITSALQQRNVAVEVIVVDDGSTDDSRDVIATFGDRIVPVFKENGGQASAYNAGFGRSSGEAVCFLDADDTLDPEAMAMAMEGLDDSEVVKFQWPLRIVDAGGRPDGRLTTVQVPPDGRLLERVVEQGPIYDQNFLTTAAYARRYLDQVMPMPEPAYRHGADVYLLTVAPVYGEIRTAAVPLGTYRIHGANNYANQMLDEVRVRDYMRRFETNSAELARHLRHRGVEPDMQQWRDTNFNYVWPKRLLEAREAIMDVVPEGGRYVLIDGYEWGAAQPIEGREATRLLERDGVYWGAPSDDDAALEALRCLEDQGIDAVVVWWTCAWWRHQYPLLFERLDARAARVEEHDAATVFVLSGASSREGM